MTRRRLAFAIVAVLAAAAALAGGARAAGGWCGGTEEVAADRQPDAAAGPQIHVVYAVPTDRPDRFAAVAPQIADDLGAADTWWRGQDPSRTLRFDTFAFPGCGSASAMLDISVVHLPHDAAYYDVATNDQAARLRVDLAPVGSNPFKKYLLYYDGPATTTADVCGHSPSRPDLGGLAATAIVLLQQGEGCGVLGTANYVDVTAVHELVHDLGAVPQPGPPHACPGDEGHVCDDDRDLLRGGGGRFPDLASYLLDAGRDDYYGHSGSWWDVQDSPWLVRLDAPQFPLAVRFEGAGAGSVTSDVPGLSCTSSCTVSWQAGTQLALQAVAGDGTELAGFAGACSGPVPECDLIVDGPKEVVVRFEPTVDLTARIVARGGTGSLRFGNGDRCAETSCVVTTTKGTPVELTAVPASGSRFVGWSGACAGAGRCAVVADAAKSVVALFGPASAPLAVRVRGKGTLTSAPARLRCPGACSASFRFGSRVRVVAHPTEGWRFAGWSGGCSGRGRCFVAAGSAHLVTATFARV